MNETYETDPDIVRSGNRIRESVRCLPRGHFQQIRQMFDKQTYPSKNLSTIHERRDKLKPYSSHILLRLPVTDDEKLQHKPNINDIITENEKSIDTHYHNKYEVLRPKPKKQSIHNSLSCLIQEEHVFKSNLSKPIENEIYTGKKTNCSHLIECQIPVLSLFINHPKFMRNKKEIE